MSASTNLPRSAAQLTNSEVLSGIGAELVFIQNASGDYLSFFWNLAEHYGISADLLVGQTMSQTLSPVDTARYLCRCQRVLDCQQPEKFSYPFRYGDRYLLFDLVVSPILASRGTATSLLVMGRLLASSIGSQVFEWQDIDHSPTVSLSTDRYQKLLTQITRNIRRTLDLDTIWQQAVTGLGEALELDLCSICLYDPQEPNVEVVAEYAADGTASRQGEQLLLADRPHFQRVLTTLEPIALIETESSRQPQAILIAATYYQNQPNGLILLYRNQPETSSQETRRRLWTAEEIELVRELADQVGTAIAHATLFAQSQTLAAEFQKVNENLLLKQKELQEANEQAAEASRLKSEFLANTSHELRTPLNGMIGFLRLIKDGMADDPEEQAEFIEEAYQSALHLLDLINDVLDLAKIEAGKMQLELSSVELEELLSDVERKTRTQAESKGLEFKVQTPQTLDPIILYGNYQRLLQVMLNLVGNAIKFTHEGSVTISMEILHRPMTFQNQDFLGMAKVRVADTGIGVSLEKQDKLFQKFVQVDGSRTREYGGTGLGLAISQKLVEAMGGEVNFFSMGAGLGSTVTFTVPLFHLPVAVG